MSNPRQDISCFCGGDLVKGRTVAWDCKDCGEQWWPHLWDKLQKQITVNKGLKTEIKELEKEIKEKDEMIDILDTCATELGEKVPGNILYKEYKRNGGKDE